MNSPPRDYRFLKAQHLRAGTDFKRVYDGAAKAGDNHLLVFGLPNELGFTRIGLSVSRKNGNAVARNRVKRLLREAFRLIQHDLPTGFDFVLIPRPGSGAGLNDYRRGLASCARRVAKRISPPMGRDVASQP